MKEFAFKIYDKLTKNTIKWREYLTEYKNASHKELKELQRGRLNVLHWSGFRTNRKNLWLWKGFNNTPLTTKEDLRNFKPILKGNETKHFSSGSTGEPLKTYGPDELQSIKSAVFERAWKSVGWNGKDKILRLTAGEPQWKLFDWLRNVKPMNYRNIGLKHYNWVINNKPFLIHGGSGAIREITTGIINLGIEDCLKDITLYLMSEDTKEHTKELKKYYKAVYSGYGLAELCTVASQCKYGNYHVNMDTCITEVIDGEIVVTDLFNNVTPVIRYKTKDYGKLKKSNCKCGRKSDILYDIEGRSIDYYDGDLTLKPLGWWILSPISNDYGHLINQWKVKVNLKKNQFILYVVWSDKILTFETETGSYPITNIDLISYREWIKEESGLDLVIKTQKSMSNKGRMKLLKVVK